MSIATERRERTAEQIARDCRRDRIVDWWISQQHIADNRAPLVAIRLARDWSPLDWEVADMHARRRTDDLPPDAELRAAVIAEIDKIADGLERRRGTA